ncbi:MAG TPA: NAD(P) transhydrogenase subunit alpha [Fimbriimonadaceae bacterium]|nr:NAD(P) transhydrogenase subunit alpha [Fimbriimonadaceae bacterium]
MLFTRRGVRVRTVLRSQESMMIVGVVRETAAGERRVALVPAGVAALKKAKLDVVVEKDAGKSAGFSDDAYKEAGAELGSSSDVGAKADIVLAVQKPKQDLKASQVGIAIFDPLTYPDQVPAKSGATLFSLDLIPRTTRAQAMDVLSSQANLGGYLGVLIGATELTKILPMMTTAAGTIPPARALILGAGVAGLQAIATARRLGAIVSGYDVRTAVKEQVESLGARFVELPLETESAQDAGGYAKALGEEFYAKQRQLLGDVLAETDLVITTAAVPGMKAPILVTAAMAERMAPGSVIVDLAAERGGNCELTKAGETVEHKGVRIIGPLNLPSRLATNASQLFSKNIQSFLLNMVKEGALEMDMEDPIVSGSLLAKGGEVVHERVKEILAKEGARG